MKYGEGYTISSYSELSHYKRKDGKHVYCMEFVIQLENYVTVNDLSLIMDDLKRGHYKQFINDCKYYGEKKNIVITTLYLDILTYSIFLGDLVTEIPVNIISKINKNGENNEKQ